MEDEAIPLIAVVVVGVIVAWSGFNLWCEENEERNHQLLLCIRKSRDGWMDGWMA
jgi:hypothetical protein